MKNNDLHPRDFADLLQYFRYCEEWLLQNYPIPAPYTVEDCIKFIKVKIEILSLNKSEFLSALESRNNKIEEISLIAGYLFGESLICARDDLKWNRGDKRSMFDGHIVVSGFSYEMECAPITLCQNVIGRALHGTGKSDDVRKFYHEWLSR